MTNAVAPGADLADARETAAKLAVMVRELDAAGRCSAADVELVRKALEWLPAPPCTKGK